MIRFGFIIFLLAGSACVNERYAQEAINIYYPSSGVTADNFAPLKAEINTDRFMANTGKLNEFIKPLNHSELELPLQSELLIKEFGPWNFPTDDFISPYERDLLVNFAQRVAEQQAPRMSGKRFKPVALIFWKDEADPQKFGIFVKYSRS